jgi:hypothetical protein
MAVRTGQTVYEDILSLDADNNPVSATTFDSLVLKDGSPYTAITLTIALADASKGIFSTSWSADTTGDYQLYIKNNSTNVVFMTDPVSVLPDSYFDQTIYIGL